MGLNLHLARIGTPSFLHTDRLGSTRYITDTQGNRDHRRTYRPFGAILFSQDLDPSAPEETKGFIGERYDADAGLQYLNARYYDPELAMFIQPDWFEVMEPGVGTNRYSYSFNDPVNLLDPSGNAVFRDGQFIGQAQDVYGTRGSDNPNEWESWDTGTLLTLADVHVNLGGLDGNGLAFGAGDTSSKTESPDVGRNSLDSNRGARFLGYLGLALEVFGKASEKRDINFHYTTLGGLSGIRACLCILAQQPTFRAHPPGAYFTQIVPGTMTHRDLSYQLFRNARPHNLEKIGHFVTVDLNGMPKQYPDPSRPHLSVVTSPSGRPISIAGRLHGWGRNPNTPTVQ